MLTIIDLMQKLQRVYLTIECRAQDLAMAWDCGNEAYVKEVQEEGTHVWMPPMRSERVGFLIRRASSPPCAVATSCTPLWAMLLAANASASVPISSCTAELFLINRHEVVSRGIALLT